jgi:hypothetical protein
LKISAGISFLTSKKRQHLCDQIACSEGVEPILIQSAPTVGDPCQQTIVEMQAQTSVKGHRFEESGMDSTLQCGIGKRKCGTLFPEQGRSKMKEEFTFSRVWFITGTSTGFGCLLAEEALKRGERVIATARDVSKLWRFARDIQTAFAH